MKKNSRLIMKASVLLITMLIVAGIGNIVTASIFKISRDELGLSEVEKCVAPEVKSFWRIYNGFPDYNNELVADYFGVYAAYASNAYLPQPEHVFQLSPEITGWSRQGSGLSMVGGFYADIFYKHGPNRRSVMVVFRGTDGLTDFWDFLSNASYFIQMLNPWDQYRTARNIFKAVRSQAQQAAGATPIEYYAVGHSLGGGLARHLAAAFPCTAAITFNSSFVANNFRLEKPYPGQVIDIFEENELLSNIAVFPNPRAFFQISDRHQWYRVRNTSVDVGDIRGKHGIYQAAAAMARIPIVCLQQTPRCELSLSRYGDEPSKTLEKPRDPADVQKLFCSAGPPAFANERGKLCKEVH